MEYYSAMKRNETLIQAKIQMNLENMEKEMATHSSILAWETPRTEEPSGLQFIGLRRVRHYSATNTFLF